MAWNGSGTYVLNPSYSPEVNGTTIDAVRYNGLLTDVASGITACLAKNGENVPTANLPMGGFKITGLAAPTTNGDALTYGSSLGPVTATTGTFSGNVQMASQNGGQLAGLRNKIINGAFTVNQRGWSSATVVSGEYQVDRFLFGGSVAGKLSLTTGALGTVGISTGAFGNSVYFTTIAAYTPGASESFNYQQRIEGYNIADLAWGTAIAKTVTLSFFVTSSLTGTFGGAIRNSAATRSYPFSYSIPVASTWTKISVTITGDTTGAVTDWLTTSGIGMSVIFSLGAGATLSGPAGAWAAASYISATGAVSVVSTLSATWNIANVQLEVGPVATPFEQIPYGLSLALCQRYYEKSYDIGIAPAANSQVGCVAWNCNTFSNTAYTRTSVFYAVNKRATPSITLYNPVTGSTAAGTCVRNSDLSTDTLGSAALVGERGFTLQQALTTLTSGNFMQTHYVAASEL